MCLTTRKKCEQFEDLKFDTKQIKFTFLDVTSYDPPHTSTAKTHEQESSTSSIKSSNSKGHIRSKLKIHFMLINLGKVYTKSNVNILNNIERT